MYLASLSNLYLNMDLMLRIKHLPVIITVVVIALVLYLLELGQLLQAEYLILLLVHGCQTHSSLLQFLLLHDGLLFLLLDVSEVGLDNDLRIPKQ
jgi:hypothetical protein